jgi:small subunit ribosomal protein S21
MQVTVKDDESLDKAIARYKKVCSKVGITTELKKRSYYEKPSEKRRKIVLKREKKTHSKRKSRSQRRSS